MKIAHLTTVDMSLRYLVLPQLEAANELGEAIGISAPGPFVAELEERGIRHLPLSYSTRGMNLASDLRAAFQLWKILRVERVDVLHTHNPKPGIYGRIVGRLAGVPIVVNTVHGLYATEESNWFKRTLVYSLEWLAAKFSDAELIQNPEDLELLQRMKIVPRAKLTYLGNGVDLDRFNPDNAGQLRAEVRSELGANDDQIIVGMVGRLVEEKGVPELLQAMTGLPENYRLVVAGPDDPDKSDALPRWMILDAEAAGVTFLGMRTDVERLYSAFDIFVLPSHREGFPRAAMEAAASGLPVVATQIRGCRQIVEPGKNGLLVPVLDPEALRAAIRQIGSDVERMRSFGKMSATIAIDRFDERRVVDTVIATYEEVAAQKGLSWVFAAAGEEFSIRLARRDDAITLAEMHARLIDTGFLAKLGVGFLEQLYIELIGDSESAVYVAESESGHVGFITGTSDTGALYKRFMRRKFLSAGIKILPSLFQRGTVRRVVETLQYGSDEPRARAELLSMAVAAPARTHGLGSRLVASLLDWGRASGIDSMKVVVGAHNVSAIRLYNRSGFVDGLPVVIHDGEISEEFIWSA